MIKDNLFDRMNIAADVNVDLSKSKAFYVFLNIDILNGCEFSCAGCYVNKGVNSSDLDSDLQSLANIADEINNSDLHLEEVALGPTDFFSAKNIVQVLTHPNFKRLFSNNKTKFVMISTLKASESEIREKLSLLESAVPHLDIDLLIATDVDEFLTNPDYIKTMKRKWEILKQSKLLFDPAFQVNIHPANLLKYDADNLANLASKIREEFDTILEFNPSILRVKHRNRGENLKFWMEVVQENMRKNADKFTYTMLNKSHSGVNNLVVNFRKGSFYVCPFIYENVFIYNDNYLIKRNSEQYHLSDLLAAQEQFFVSQMQYSEKTNDCTGCEYLVSCTYKKVLTYMEENQIKDCFLGIGNGAKRGCST